MDPADQQNTDAAAAAAAGTTTDAAGQGTQDATTTAEPGLADVLAFMKVVKAEIADMRREGRSAKATPGRGAAASSATAAAPTWSAEDRLNFRDDIDVSGIVVTPQQRVALERLAKAEGVTEDRVQWIRDTHAAYWGRATAAPPAPTKAITAPAPSGTEAGKVKLPDNPADLTQAQRDAMSQEQLNAHREAWRKRTGKGPANPFGNVGAAPRK